MPNRINTRINLFPNVSVRFLQYVSAKQPTAKNKATNHAMPLTLPPHRPPHQSCHRHRHRCCCFRHHCCRPCRRCHHPCCRHLCCRQCPCLSSLPLLPSSSTSLFLTLLLSLPVVLTVLAGYPCPRCRCPHCCHSCRCRRPCLLSLPSLPVVVIVLAISSSAAFG
jgi:hypothetical protein